jgi:ribonucleoside-diphosphate reductase alpha chain
MPEVQTQMQMKDQTKTQSAASNNAGNKKTKAPGLTFRRLFTKPGVSPYDEIEWELRNAQITDSQGGMIFEQKNVEVPKDWSMTATNIVASKYLHGQVGTDERETGARQLVARVAETIRDWGMKPSTTNSSTCFSARTWPSTRPSGST